jgi:beta-galactosidase
MLLSDFNDDWYVVRERPTPDNGGKPAGPFRLPRDEMIGETRSPKVPAAHNNGYYPGGTYRYTKTFTPSGSWRGRQVIAQFESIYHRSKVFLNGKLVGGRPSGYITVHVDLTPHLRYDEENVIEVVADNFAQPNSRWYTGSGIYRPVHLLVGGSTSIKPFGLYLHTKSLTGSRALIGMTIKTKSLTSQPVYAIIEVECHTVHGDIIGSLVASTKFQARLGGEAKIAHTFEIDNVAPWTCDSPSLYQVTVRLKSLDGESLDTAIDRIGVRTVELTPERGLCINGKRVLLRGACIHHDNGVIGAVTLPEAEDRRVRILQEAGFNAIRSAHNSISIATLNACDKYGVLVMDEHTDIWFMSKGAYDYHLEFEEWWERDLEAMVNKDYNHPSVIVYSVGNEIMDTATPWGIEQANVMASACKSLDPHRYTTMGINGTLNMMIPVNKAKPSADISILDNIPDKVPGAMIIKVLNLVVGAMTDLMGYLSTFNAVDRKTKGVFDALDIAGYNYLIERYEMDTKKYPRRMIVGSETGAMAGVTTWPLVEKTPQLLGDFVWTGWDYLGEASIAGARYERFPSLGHPFPAHLAGEPFVDITGFMQPQCEHSKTAWHLRPGQPYLAVRPLPLPYRPLTSNIWRTTDALHSWSWDRSEGEPSEIAVYSDPPRVSLILNGKEIGSQPAGQAHHRVCRFTTRYAPGILEAIAYDDQGRETGRDQLRSADASSVIVRLSPEKSDIKADGDDLLYVPVTLVDASGEIHPTQKATISVSVSGPAILIGFGNADPFNPRGYSTREHDIYQGRALIVLRSTKEQGRIVVVAKAQDLPEAVLTVTARK